MTRSYRSQELPIHRSILHYLRLVLPGALIHHSPQNLGTGNGKDAGIARAVALSKSLGMTIGFPDLLVICNGHVLGFEVKVDGGTTSDAQKAVGALFIANGAHWAVVRCIGDVEEYLREWKVL